MFQTTIIVRVVAWSILILLVACGGSSSQVAPPGGGDGGGGGGGIVDGAAPGASASQNLRVLRDANGDFLDVGVLIIGHSTSKTGDYPGKLVEALNGNIAQDGRNYVVFDGITLGDGGFLWDFLMLAQNDPQYARVANAEPDHQWNADADNNRWSCRRLKLERYFSSVDPVGDLSVCPDSSPSARMSCTYKEAGQTKTEDLSFADCWGKMDLHIALVQDTSNRSFPVDDYNASGDLDAADYLPLDTGVVATEAVPCGAGTLNPSGSVNLAGRDYLDFDCDGGLSDADLPQKVYAAWLHDLSEVLLVQYGVDHVFLSQKPMEIGSPCSFLFYPDEQGTCGRHETRTATADRPFDHFYTPTVYWEFGALEALFDTETDNRVHRATYGSLMAMWDKSVQCYTNGLVDTDFTIPLAIGRPSSVAADVTEDDAADPKAPTGADTIGCMDGDHVHHTQAGGWMMADVWYQGLIEYLYE